MLPVLQSVVDSLQHVRQEWLAEWEQSIIKLATGIAAQIIRREVSRAPEIHFLNVNSRETISPHWLKIADVAAIVAPWNCLGGIPMLVAAARGIPIIAVKDNDTLLNVSRDTLNYGDCVVEVENYLEAAALAKRIVNGHPHLLSDKERSGLLSEGFDIAEETGMAIESLIRPVVPFEEFAKG